MLADSPDMILCQSSFLHDLFLFNPCSSSWNCTTPDGTMLKAWIQSYTLRQVIAHAYVYGKGQGLTFLAALMMLTNSS